MLFLKLVLRIVLYLLSTTAVVAIALLFKFLFILLGDGLIYKIPLAGDVLLSMEILEILNILVFAILGMGFGVATVILPRYFGIKVSQIVLVILIPLIFTTSTFFRYHQWVQDFQITERISHNQSELITNSFLRKQTNGQQEGLWGFYLYTANIPILPSNEKDMIELDAWMTASKNRVMRITGQEEKMVLLLFASRGWGLRIFYLIVSIMATIVNFKEGLKALHRIAGSS